MSAGRATGSTGDAVTGVLEALKYACSQDPSVLKVGEQQLKAWENQKGFYTALAVSTPWTDILHAIWNIHWV